MLEVALLAPLIFFLGIGVFDFGYYATALISMENAARAAVLHTSSSAAAASDNARACQYVLREMHGLGNAYSLTSCSALPLIVTATQIAGADGAPAAEVAVTYQTPRLIPIPGLAGQLTITRRAQMRLKES